MVLGYGETVKRINRHLLDVLYKQYKFKEHCLAIKSYLLLGQGDFVQYLMDIFGPELSEAANTISSFKLAGLLERAIRLSNVQYDDFDILDRLRVKMMPHRKFLSFDPWGEGSYSGGGIVMAYFGVNCISDGVKKKGLTLVDARIDLVKNVEDKLSTFVGSFHLSILEDEDHINRGILSWPR